jgi:hypothetical protein
MIVYTWWDKFWTPYYVGITAGNRQDRHRASHAEQNIPAPPSKEHITTFECNSLVEMYGNEIALIEFYGRKCDGGTLVNQSTGGKSGTAGIRLTPEQKQERSIATKQWMKIQGHPQLGRRGSSSHNSLTYLVTTPDGYEIKVHGITQFCRENNLSPSAMVRVSKGRQPFHKGYTCMRSP